ncbi:aspartate aminotransferase family protein [Saccharopolyspora sp. HNM0983]|uniref:Aspartate aminotransferase family protein n=1 Tax=Saccharopolyspora montiporae TaxID=2781240 RepID=A0A929B8L1_9PSEU|nr:aminotransferase class V-fold PLP-dependent enzyme [Saccharopolyspora sp. HNM0983]MBE9375229.1 aspartate aminotransferase family protein [Saccharopolyspora sp. HNM0983]
MTPLPHTGNNAADVLAELRSLRSADTPTHGGRTLAYVYDSGLAGLDELTAAAHSLAAHANALDPTVFPSLRRMENDLVAAAAQLLGDPQAVGTATSGGTESCLLAVLAARERRPDAAAPTVVAPATAHAAFSKAAHLFGVRLVRVPVDESTFRADPERMAAACDADTVLVVASAPSYAHGVVDPVPEIAAAAEQRGIPVHVDACIGGWVLPYLRRVGAPVPSFGFENPGVSSISVDLHKYAYSPKGTSVLLHAEPGMRRGQYFAAADWPGYTMLNTTLQSTRSGGPIAAAWAALQHIGDDGYLQLAADTYAAVHDIRAGVQQVPRLRVLGEPDATLLAVAAEDGADFDLFTVADEMRDRGWYVQPQFAHASSPVNLHLTVTASNRGSEAEFARDLADAVVAARAAGPVQLEPEVAEFIAELDPQALTDDEFAGLLAAAGMAGGAGLPERMAPVNVMLAHAAPQLRERLLVEFLGELYRP